MWCLGTRFSGGLGSVRLTVGLDDLKGLLQPKWFYDSKLELASFLSVLLKQKLCGMNTALVSAGGPELFLCIVSGLGDIGMVWRAKKRGITHLLSSVEHNSSGSHVRCGIWGSPQTLGTAKVSLFMYPRWWVGAGDLLKLSQSTCYF